MIIEAPNIDGRKAADIEKQVLELLPEYLKEQWPANDPVTGKPVEPSGISAALIKIFSRYSEMIIQRLNQAPDKNFLAFIDLLGESLNPPQSARVPLTFSLSPGSTEYAAVPAGTQVAAPPAEGEKDPVIFETEGEVIITAAALKSLYVRDPGQDRYADRSSIVASPLVAGAPVFRGDRRIEHILYVGDSRLFGFPEIRNLTLSYGADQELGDNGIVAWEQWNGTTWELLAPTSVPGSSPAGIEYDFGAITAIPVGPVDDDESRWLRCRLVTPVTQSPTEQDGMVRASELPEVRDLTAVVELEQAGLPLAHAVVNTVAADVSKEFYLFGEKPKFGDTLYLACGEAFSQASATVVLHVGLVNPFGAENPPVPVVNASADLLLKWEFLHEGNWMEIGRSNAQGAVTASPDAGTFSDTTKAFTATGEVSFTFPKMPSTATISGITDFWIRVRMVSGNYGKEAYYEPKSLGSPPEEGYILFPATFAPPVAGAIAIDYAVTISGPPEAVKSYNDFVYLDHTEANDNSEAFSPFQATGEAMPSLYFGLEPPPGKDRFPNHTIAVYGSVVGLRYGEKTIPIAPELSRQAGDHSTEVVHTFLVTNDTPDPVEADITTMGWNNAWDTTVTGNATGSPDRMPLGPYASQEVAVRVAIPADGAAQPGDSDRGMLNVVFSDRPEKVYTATFTTLIGAMPASEERPKLSWKYWNGSAWARLTVRDDTENFSRPGVVTFLAPKDFTRRMEFGLAQYWVRVAWESGDYRSLPRLRRVLLNTTMAAQIVTMADEVLGSSSGSEEQRYQTTRKPVLAGQRLVVREPEVPTAEEQEAISRVEGQDAVDITYDAAGQPREIWVRWHEVPDFYGSGPRDRHYVIDHLSGEISFGDGVNGLIPPRGAGNIRMKQYQTGGGTSGNRPAETITQLKTTVPYVEKVVNTEEASGGADAETKEALYNRAPKTIRHRDRAVTFEDYEDLAMLASPAVARAKCIPLRDLAADPFGVKRLPGAVSVIIVPSSSDVKPLPGQELITRVQDYLDEHGVPTASLSVVGPHYLRVDVTVEVALASLEGSSAVEQAVQQALDGFLHPLTGGAEGVGWDFGREPRTSDLFVLIEAIPGVEYIRYLKVDDTAEDPFPEIKDSGRFLVYSGDHTISLMYDEES